MEKLHSRYESCIDKVGRNHLEKHKSRILRGKKEPGEVSVEIQDGDLPQLKER